MLSELRLRYKYLKHKIKKSPRYLLTKRVVSFLENAPDDTPPTGLEREQLLDYLRHHVVEFFNYHSLMLKYHYRPVKVFLDKETGLRYVFTDENRRLFFKRDMKTSFIRAIYNRLCLEQDEQSPHNYCFHDLSIHSDSVFTDVGAAEGLFTLKFIDQIKTAYLFECDNGWIEALQATFRPWKEKVVIVNKFVSDKDNDEFTSLDSFFCNREKPTLIKMDVEGAESDVLKGADQLLDKGINDILVCTYHQNDDEHNLSEQLRKKKYKTVPSQGYMLMISDNLNDSLKEPYFRKGLIHASPS
ncbi:MAG: FkbM family methyltransferase [Bacteroidales bacterium]|nr:FkbM family methyltransferase [Bacteroidales bacterium]